MNGAGSEERMTLELPTSQEPARYAVVRNAAILALAWTPFAGLWMLFVKIFLDSSLEEAVYSGVAAMGNAALLAVGVWYLVGVYPWPRRLRPVFYFSHIAIGVAYSFAWILMGQAESVLRGVPTVNIFSSPLASWRIIMGIWLYGCVAGVSYAVRGGRRAVEQERLLARAESLAVEARLEMLRSQLNPHFLFNSLHTIRALVSLEPEVAREAVERLGRLLRYALDQGASGEVTMAQEWNFVEDYLALERMRLGDRLRTFCVLTTEAASQPVPPFLIQPIVENAVIHGVSPKIEGGSVRVLAQVESGNLEIVISDDGVGADPTTISEGHGHRLLRERLKGLYGDRASVALVGAPGDGFRTIVVIPAQPLGSPLSTEESDRPPNGSSQRSDFT